MGRVEAGRKDEYRDPVKNVVKWQEENHLQLNMVKIKAMMLDLRRNKHLPSPVCFGETDVDIVKLHKYQGVVLDNKQERSTHTDAVLKKGLSRLYFLRRLRSFYL